MNILPPKPAVARSQRPGFTLIEILVVIAIVGILSTLAAISISSYRVQSRVNKAEADIDAIRSAVFLLGNATGEWPSHEPADQYCQSGSCADNEVWDLNLPEAGLTQNDTTPYANWEGPYMTAVPTDPWGNSYFFDSDYDTDPTVGTENWATVVGSFGPDAQDANPADHQNVYDSPEGDDNIILVLAP